MKRADALRAIRFAGYHEDTAGFVRLYVEHRVSMPAAKAEYAAGLRAKLAGVRCGCLDCRAAPNGNATGE